MQKIILTLIICNLLLTATAQKIPFEILDSLSNSIAQLERKTENNIYKDLNEDIHQLSFPEENFKVWSYNRLASKAVYKRIGEKEVLAFTDNIDLSKATALLIEEPHSGITYVKMEFQKGYLKTQLVENGRVMKTTAEDYLEFFCLYGKLDQNKKFAFDNLYDQLYQLCARFKIEKGLMKEEDLGSELADWNTMNGSDFAAKYPKSLKAKQALGNATRQKAEEYELARQRKVIRSYMEQYKFKKGLRLSEFTEYNKEAARIVKKSNYNSYGNTANYNTIKGIGKPFPDGPFIIVLESKYSDIVSSFEYIIMSEKNEEQVMQRYHTILTDLQNKLDKKYISIDDKNYKFVVPGAAANITIRYINFNKWHVVSIFFE